MKIRAKFRVVSITHHEHGHAKVALEPRYDQGIPEDQRFSKFTPSGRLEMGIDSPAVLDELKIGKDFYLDLIPADA